MDKEQGAADSYPDNFKLFLKVKLLSDRRMQALCFTELLCMLFFAHRIASGVARRSRTLQKRWTRSWARLCARGSLMSGRCRAAWDGPDYQANGICSDYQGLRVWKRS